MQVYSTSPGNVLGAYRAGIHIKEYKDKIPISIVMPNSKNPYKQMYIIN